VNPEIIVFSCNWDGWSCIETAINTGLKYPSSVKIVKVNCLSRIHTGLILQALDLGADGVMLLGCETGKCHFDTNNDCIAKEYEKVQNILELLGMNKDRVILVRLPAFNGRTFIKKLTSLIDTVKQISNSDRNRENNIRHSVKNTVA